MKATTNSDGVTSCKQRHNYYKTLMLGFPDFNNPQNQAYFVTTQCVEKWVWDHCDMPAEHTTYPVILAGKQERNIRCLCCHRTEARREDEGCEVCGIECRTCSNERKGYKSSSNFPLTKLGSTWERQNRMAQRILCNRRAQKFSDGPEAKSPNMSDVPLKPLDLEKFGGLSIWGYGSRRVSICKYLIVCKRRRKQV